jgi:hypothetical protein
MRIKYDNAKNPYIDIMGKNGSSIVVKMNAATRDFNVYASSPAKGLSIDRIRKATVFKSDAGMVLFFSLNESAAFSIADAVIVLRNWEPETQKSK